MRLRALPTAQASFRGDAKHRTRNLEIPDLVLTHHPGMTGSALHHNKKAQAGPALFVNITATRNYSPTAAARSVFFSTMRADLPRRLRR
jgi:hypothetical protein